MKSNAIVNGKCVYPKRGFDNNRTVTKEEIKDWKKWRKKGMSIDKIAEISNRSDSVISYYLTNYGKKVQLKSASKYIMDRYESKYKNYYRIRNNINQKKRYQDDLDYRFYQHCKLVGCKSVVKNWGSLENYYSYRKKLFKAEKDPNITEKQYKDLKLKLWRKMRLT